MTALLAPLAAAVPSEALLRRMAGPGPRYTSYPTADRFDDSFGAPQLEALLDARRRAAEGGDCAPLSLYVHVPFCESVCDYCACNKVITKHHSKGAAYVESLEQEMGLVIDHLGAGRRARSGASRASPCCGCRASRGIWSTHLVVLVQAVLVETLA